MLNRREMLARSALMSLSPLVPAFVARTARSAVAERDAPVLVVVQLDGGNDGLNAVVPHRDENYRRLRPTLRQQADTLVKLNDELGLHGSMKPAGALFDAGRWSVIQSVGYPNPDRSHFRSMAIWHSARTDAADHGQYGWLGRALDSHADPASPQGIYVGGGSLPESLWSRRAAVTAFASLEESRLERPAGWLRPGDLPPDQTVEPGRSVARLCDEAFATAERLAQVQPAPASADAGGYSRSSLARQLGLISALLKSGSAARVYYAAQSGYDTHATQAFEHSRLLRELAEGVKHFLDDLAAAGLAERVLVMAFSEFGRRAAENDSAGTDHGAAGPVFVAGPRLARGIVGPPPDLQHLVEGDVPMAIDFRQVYATILRQWLGIPPADLLGGTFDELPLFSA